MRQRRIQFTRLDRRINAETYARETDHATEESVPVLRLSGRETPLVVTHTADGRDLDEPTDVAREMRKKYDRKGALTWIER